MRISTAFVFASLVSGISLVGSSPANAGLSGAVLHFDGSAVSDAPVWIRNAEAGIDERTMSSADGRYEFPDLPPGDYRLTVTMPCCLFMPYVNDSVDVARRGTTEFDIQLVAFNVDVEGDNPYQVTEELIDRQTVPDLPVPRMPDGRPDLSGVWLPTDDPFPEDAKPLEWAGKIAAERAANFFIDSPSAHCLPGSLPLPGGATFTARFVQRPELLVILFEDVPGFRQIYLDGREHPANPNPTWMGHSIGRWDGDTLIVDTVGYNDLGWTDIFPRTTMLRTEERYTRTSYGDLKVKITWDDPGVFEQPFSRNMVWKLAPQIDLMEYVCENNVWIDTTASDVGLEP